MYAKFAVGIASLILVGCATVSATFDASEVAWFQMTGANTLKGSALARQNDGGVVSCAGRTVSLFPASAYAVERAQAFYGKEAGGYNFAGWGPAGPQEAAFQSVRRNAVCDVQGFFVFKDLPDGDYYVAATIQWSASGLAQGIDVARRVRLEGGETEEVVLSDQMM